jgi:hypothetical protein
MKITVKHFVRGIVKLILGVVLGLGLLYGIVFAWFWWHTHPVIRLSAYQHILAKRWGGRSVIQHFPKQIPYNSTLLQLYYRPGFLQGGSHFEVRLKTTQQFIGQEYLRFASGNTNIWNGSRVQADQFLYVNFHTIDFVRSINFENGTISLLPAEYDVVLLNSEHGNHGCKSVVALNSNKSEIIYWAEKW